MTKFQTFARNNHKPGQPIDEMMHPEIIAECMVMDKEELDRIAAIEEEYKAKKAADKARIKEVVESVADINAELAGRIVVKVSFAGSLAKSKRLTKAEVKLVMALPEGVKVPIGGEKPLFECEEYDALTKFISDRRDEFASYGIPHVKFQAAHVVDITRIPEIEDLAEQTEVELPLLVEKVAAVWAAVIEKAEADLGPLFNPQDYRPVEALKGLFSFDYAWMAFGVPDELKQFDVRIYNKAQAKAKAIWAEVEANGVALLRTTISDLVAGLADSLTPKDGGERKKFYPTSVEKINQFIETFSRRNICKDVELEVEVEKLRKVVSGIEVDKLSAGAKGDDALREKVRKQMEAAKATLSALVTDASARAIRFED